MEVDLPYSVDSAVVQSDNVYKGDEKLGVRFYHRGVENKAKSAEAGRPVFEDVPYIYIRIPGTRDDIDRRARIGRRPMDDNQRFAKHYEAFLKGQEQAPVGTPLRSWPGVTAAQVETLVYMRVRTVEELAALPDAAGQGLMGFHQLRQRAIDYLEAAKDTAHTTKLRAELDGKESRIAALERQLAELNARAAALPAPEAPKQQNRK